LAPVVIAGFRGFTLDYGASQDCAQVDQSAELWRHKPGDKDEGKPELYTN
jgi:hypothetical protein